MRIVVDLKLTRDRITAHRGGTLVFDDVAVVALRRRADGADELVGIWSDRIDRVSTMTVPILSDIQFRPEIAAGVARFVVMKAWMDSRTGSRWFRRLLDRVEGRITIDGYDRMGAEAQQAFARFLQTRPPRTRWWVNGVEVRT